MRYVRNVNYAGLQVLSDGIWRGTVRRASPKYNAMHMENSSVKAATAAVPCHADDGAATHRTAPHRAVPDPV